MTLNLDSFLPSELGDRLKVAREDARLTQAASALAADMSRTTLVSIENGQRRVRLDELRTLAKLYGKTINELLRRERIQVNLLPQFRRISQSENADVEHAVKLLNDLVQAEIELEQLLGVTRSTEYPPESPIRSGNAVQQAEEDAMNLRRWLGIGLNPINDIFGILEMQLGARIYVRKLPSSISGLFAFDDNVGPCILLNANHPRDRRANTAAHETGHFIATRRAADVLDESMSEGVREERYANAFGRALLMPATAVQQKFIDITAGASELTRRHVIILANFFGVAREPLVRRLEELKLINKGGWDYFTANGGITNLQAEQVLGFPQVDEHLKDASRPVSLRMSLMAEEVWRRGLLSEGQLSRLLHLNRVELRTLVDGLGIEGDEADGAPKLLI